MRCTERARRKRALYDLRAGARSQVYGGAGCGVARVWEVVQATRGEVMTSGGQPILAVFHSSSGGRTASAKEVWGGDLPYLASVVVEGEEASPDTLWQIEVSAAELAELARGLGTTLGALRDAAVVERSPSGRVRRLRLRGDAGSVTVPARALRAGLGTMRLRSTLFDLRSTPTGLLFVGSGFGHGVGMSQWGALALARAGASYREILAHFYQGVRLERLDEAPSVAQARSASSGDAASRYDPARAEEGRVSGVLLQAGPPAGPDFGFFVMMGLILLIMYFFIMRPQQRQRREHGQMLKALSKGDEVVTTGGLQGTITGDTEDVLTLEIARLKSGERVRVKVARARVESRLRASGGEDQ